MPTESLNSIVNCNIRNNKLNIYLRKTEQFSISHNIMFSVVLVQNVPHPIEFFEIKSVS